MKTNTLLNKTPYEYENLKMMYYLRWCMDFVTDMPNYSKELQKILANRPVSNFFNQEWAKVETEFLEIMVAYPNTDTHEALATFGRCLVQLFNRSPKELIRQAKSTDKSVKTPSIYTICNN